MVGGPASDGHSRVYCRATLTTAVSVCGDLLARDSISARASAFVSTSIIYRDSYLASSLTLIAAITSTAAYQQKPNSLTVFAPETHSRRPERKGLSQESGASHGKRWRRS